MEGDAAIEVDALVKSFGPLRAVDGISFRVGRGEMFGLVGPDGAGKSTTIRMLCGILPPDAGHGRLLGFDVVRDRREIHRRLGYLSQRFSLYGDLSIDENIEFFARIHGVRDFRKKRDELLEFTRLAPFRERLAERLSGGMKQKLALACTLIHDPEVIFLDEPTTGVDPVTRRDFWKLLAELLKRGTTILLTTPYLDEAERCNHVALMDRGRLLALDTPAALRAHLGQRVLEIVCSPARRAREILRSDPAVTAFFEDIQTFGERLDLLYEGGDDDEALRLAQAALEGSEVTIASSRRKSPSLENVFITLIKRERSDMEVAP